MMSTDEELTKVEELEWFETQPSSPIWGREDLLSVRALAVVEGDRVEKVFTRVGSCWVPLPECETIRRRLRRASSEQ
jgi:hypothetical protein